MPNGMSQIHKAPETDALFPTPTTAPPPTTSTPNSVSFTPNQYRALRAQIAAFRHLSSGQPVPPETQKAIYVRDSHENAGNAATSGQPSESNTQNHAQVSDEKKAEAKAVAPALILPEGRILEQDKASAIYPYNAYTSPFDLLKNSTNSVIAVRKRVVIPSLMPTGIDPYQIVAERNRFVEARIAQRIRELSALGGMAGDGGLQPPIGGSSDPEMDGSPLSTGRGKLQALIELKSLKLREKQRALRAAVTQRLADASALTVDRREFRRHRKPHPRDAKQTEQLEKKQRQDRERRVKQKHLDYLAFICDHGRELIARNRAGQARMQRLGKAVLNFHVHTEKEEQKRIERISKERLKALKADDEVAYLKLLDTAKDTRITQLLRQTDGYLDSLAAAVVAQQNDDVHRDIAALPFETEDRPADETTFGATRMEDENEESKSKVDYYSVAHRISEKVTTQPKLLAGGTLKDYQIKGLQWMVSLYNNRLNGILADEMVRFFPASFGYPPHYCHNRVLERRSKRFRSSRSLSNASVRSDLTSSSLHCRP